MTFKVHKKTVLNKTDRKHYFKIYEYIVALFLIGFSLEFLNLYFVGVYCSLCVFYSLVLGLPYIPKRSVSRKSYNFKLTSLHSKVKLNVVITNLISLQRFSHTIILALTHNKIYI